MRRSARLDAVFAPVLLGLLTILIPCGVTLSVMFLAVASGSPLWSAAAMGVFVVGTSPLFATVGFLVRRGARRLRRFVAVGSGLVVLGSGLVALNTGLVLADAPFTFSDALQQAFGSEPAVAAPPVGTDGTQHLVINVASTSYSPGRLTAAAGVPTDLTFRRRGVHPPPGRAGTMTLPWAAPSAPPVRTWPSTRDRAPGRSCCCNA